MMKMMERKGKLWLKNQRMIFLLRTKQTQEAWLKIMLRLPRRPLKEGLRPQLIKARMFCPPTEAA